MRLRPWLLAVLSSLVAWARCLKLLRHPVHGDKWIEDDLFPKLLFFAGVEGSGQSLVESLWGSFYPGAGNASQSHILPLPEEWKCGNEWTAEAVTNLTRIMRTIPERSLWSFPASWSTYPSCRNGSHGSRVDLDFVPHLDYIARAAHVAEVDLRVVILYRPLKDALAAECMSRHTESCGLQALTVEANTKYLMKQLSQIHPSRIACFQHLGSSTMEKEVRLQYGLDSPFADKVVDVLFEESVSGPLRKRFTEWNQYVAMLQDLSLQLFKFCRTSSRLNLGDLRKLAVRFGGTGPGASPETTNEDRAEESRPNNQIDPAQSDTPTVRTQSNVDVQMNDEANTAGPGTGKENSIEDTAPTENDITEMSDTFQGAGDSEISTDEDGASDDAVEMEDETARAASASEENPASNASTNMTGNVVTNITVAPSDDSWPYKRILRPGLMKS